MAEFETIQTTQVDSKSPINELLMLGNSSLEKGGVKFNFDSLNDRVVALEGAGGGGGGGAASSGDFADVIQGAELNLADYWKKRFHPMISLNAGSGQQSPLDLYGDDKKSNLLVFPQTNDQGLLIVADAACYLGHSLSFAKSSNIAFKVKRGINFFILGFTMFSTACDNVQILINGQTPSSLGLTDENGNVAPDFLNTNSATTFYQNSFSFYGLDGSEAVVELLNNDSASKAARIEFIEIGFRSVNPTIDNNVTINAGRAVIKGAEISFSKNVLAVSQTEKNGHIASVVGDKAGGLSIINGESPAMTMVRSEVDVDYTTQLDVMNSFYFPDNGICVLSTPYGDYHAFSYASKTEALVQANRFNGVIWQSKPNRNFIPRNSFLTGTGTATGDLIINYFGTAPIVVDTTNNKLDFAITIEGVRGVYAATIPSGRYSADIVSISDAITKAMQIAKPINGKYSLTYNSISMKWALSVNDSEVEELELLFASGVNIATSIANTLGFGATDFENSTSYIASIEKQHLCAKVFQKSSVYMQASNPRVKYAAPHQYLAESNEELDALLRLGFGGAVRNILTSGNFFQIFPSNECAGIQLDFISYNNGGQMTYQIDDGPVIYGINTSSDVINPNKARILSGFISFPKGSRKITIRQETSTQFDIGSTTNYLLFLGYNEYFLKPSWEKLTSNQAILHCVEVSAISLYATIYGHNAGTLYSPSSDDQINTITESGTWTGATFTAGFNNGIRSTNTINSYVDVSFDLQGDGGGIMFKMMCGTDYSDKVALFLSASAINESTDRISNTHLKWGAIHYDQDCIGVLGLPAGTYIARLKTEDNEFIRTNGIIIVDTKHPKENSNTVTDVSNNGQSISYPLNVYRQIAQQDSDDFVPTYLRRTGYNQQNQSGINYKLNSLSIFDVVDSTNLIVFGNSFYGNDLNENIAGLEFKTSGFFKSITALQGGATDGATTCQNFVDGIQFLNSYSLRVQTKSGSAPSATRGSYSRFSQKLFNLNCSFDSGDTFLINDTRGIKVNQTVILFDGTNYEKVVVDSIVTGTSFTVKKARTIVVDANVVRVDFSGFHSFRITQTDAGIHRLGAFEYEPLKLTKSNYIENFNVEYVLESVTVYFKRIRRMDNTGTKMFYPLHSDGVQGNWNTSSIQLIAMDLATNAATSSYNENIVYPSGVAGVSHKVYPDLRFTSTWASQDAAADLYAYYDFKITSTRLVPRKKGDL